MPEHMTGATLAKVPVYHVTERLAYTEVDFGYAGQHDGPYQLKRKSEALIYTMFKVLTHTKVSQIW